VGGGRQCRLGVRDAFLLTAVWMRHYVTQEALGYFAAADRSQESQIVVELGTGSVREVSPSVPGPVADPPFLRGSGMRERLGPDHRAMGDLGYVGADKDKGNDATGKATGRATGKGATDTGAEDKKEKERVGGVIPRIVTPRRTPRGQPRPPEDVVFNRTFARARTVVEHSIRDLRIYQALSQVDRRRRTGHERRVCAVVGLRARRCRPGRRDQLRAA